jgi:signal transduction histidine kinase
MYPVTARGSFLDKGEYLVVGESQFRAERAQEAIALALGWGIAITVVLAAGGGAALGIGFLRRIEEINRTARSIMEGDLSKRVPTRGGGDEMEQLAVNLNAMLDRIQALMESLKQVSDDIAHDLKTPLSRLRHRLEAAADKPEPERSAIIEHSISELDAILETFSALLRIGQIESGVRRAAFSKVDLAQVVSTVAETYVPVAEDHGQTLRAAVGGHVHRGRPRTVDANGRQPHREFDPALPRRRCRFRRAGTGSGAADALRQRYRTRDTGSGA